MGLPRTASATARTESSVYTTPVGLLGVLMRMALVLSVTRALSLAASIWKPSPLVSRKTGTPPARRTSAS